MPPTAPTPPPSPPGESRRECRSIGIVVPVYNEVLGLAELHAELTRVLRDLPCPASIWYVDDGSSDGTAALVEQWAAADPRVHLLELSRNFGHQAALTAGMDYVQDDVLVVMDGDGQHPPSLILRMVELYQAGYDVVLTRRADTKGAGIVKKACSNLFYTLINRVCSLRIPPQAADFRLMSRNAALALGSLREYHRFLRGMVSWIGFRQTTLDYTAPLRIAGRTKYSISKMLGLAAHALFSFSKLPLRLCFIAGITLLLLSAAEAIHAAYIFFSPRRGELVPGWSSLMFFIIAIGGVQLIVLGIIGNYIGYVFEEVKRRPVYIVRRHVAAGGRAAPAAAPAPPPPGLSQTS
ncbi:MAG: glycosyltransferase family 2 protein [Bryobacterales bacterium]|nr:glycosyltransferase family 2 protein [Bryobacterales bacterium]